MTGGGIRFDPPGWVGVLSQSPPMPLTPGQVGSPGGSPIDATVAAFGLATNIDLPTTNAQIAEDDADRKAHATEALQKFGTNEADAVSQFEDVGANGAGQMAQQMPQEMMGAIQGVTGALTGALGSLGKLPQGLLQAGQGVLSPLMGAAQSLGQGGLGGLSGLGEASLASDFDPDPVGTGAGLGAGGGGLGTGTTPASNLGPPPVPASSIPTTPAAAASIGTPGASAPAGGSGGGMGGGGMMPMGAGSGAGDKGAKGTPPGEKRITAPGVPNGQPVKGRSTLPPNVPVTKTSAGRAGEPIIVRKRVVSDEDSPA